MKDLWLRREDKAGERRVPITPVEVAALVKSGVQVTIERSTERCFSDANYAAAGATLTAASWQDAPLDTVIIALKELEESAAPIAHTQIHFSHTFKGQDGAQEVLARYSRGGGTLYDLEFLFDTQGRRVAAFGYWAGFVGAALGLLGVAHFSQEVAGSGVLAESPTPFPKLSPFADRVALVTAVDAALSGCAMEMPLRTLIMGALGRCGSGARDLIESLATPIEVSAWDLAEFSAVQKPLAAALAHDLFVNCVYLREAIDPMIDEALLAGNGRLKVISDISCDPTSPDNPIRVYDAITSLEQPFVRARGTGAPVYVQAIDHLPTLLPRESSQEYAAALFPYLHDFLTSPNPSATWQNAKTLFTQTANPGSGLSSMHFS
jgi:saccharopine dehydrogenase (NAD+, L-lysine-forming)